MPQNSQLLALILLIVPVLVVILGIWGLFLPANSQASPRTTKMRRARRQAKLEELEGLNLFADSPWPELHFDMEVADRRFFGVALITGGVLIALLVFGFYPVVSERFLLALELCSVVTIPGLWLALPCIPRWQSHVVLESERVVVQRTFGRSPKVVHYNQICFAGEQERGTAVLIRYYPLMLDGQADRSRMQQLKVPATTHDEGLLLSLRARMCGLPLDRKLESELLSRYFARRFALLGILFGTGLLVTVLERGNQARPEIAYFGLLAEISLILIVITMLWPERHK